MTTAVTAVKANLGVTGFAYLLTAAAAGWSFLWSVAFVGILDRTYECTENAVGAEVCSNPNYGYLFLLFLSFFFGHQVIQNSVHVTVCGVVGNWWVAPGENGFCGKAVCNSFIRTVTTSFGSICFGVSIFWICGSFASFETGSHPVFCFGSFLDYFALDAHSP